MKAATTSFNSIIENIYNLPLEYKEELKDLLEHNIADARRSEIERNYKSTQKEHKAGKLKFSSSVQDIKKML